MPLFVIQPACMFRWRHSPIVFGSRAAIPPQRPPVGLYEGVSKSEHLGGLLFCENIWESNFAPERA